MMHKRRNSYKVNSVLNVGKTDVAIEDATFDKIFTAFPRGLVT